MTDDVEAVAKYMAEKEFPSITWEQNYSKLTWLRYAQAAIAALRSLGWQKVEPGMVVVPSTPTEEMTVFGARSLRDTINSPNQRPRADAVYRAMTAAAEGVKQ